MINLPRSKPPLVIAGSGRSGTTWLSDELARCARTRTVFEPLHSQRVPGVPNWGVRSGVPGKFIASDAVDEAMHSFVERLLDGRIENHWTQQTWRYVPAWTRRRPRLEGVAYSIAGRIGRRRRVRGERMVIKFIKANLMLGWLTRNFKLDVIYVVRHPCQVVGSRRVRGWRSNLEDVVSQPELMNTHLDPFREVIESANTAVRQLAVLWCVENLLPLRERHVQPWITLSYEDCARSPEETFERLGQQLGLPVARAPQSVSPNRAKWFHPLSQAEGREVLGICRDFGIEIYGEESLPQTTFANALRVPSKSPISAP